MRSTILLLLIVALMACVAFAGPNPGTAEAMLDKARKNGKTKSRCAKGKGKMKNGKCVRSLLRVRSAGSEDFVEIPDVEDAHWVDERGAEIGEM